MFVVPLFVIRWRCSWRRSISRGVRGATLFRIVFFFPNLSAASRRRCCGCTSTTRRAGW
jgi:hypothetical protein